MKKNIRTTIFFALLPVFILLLLTQGCKKATDNTIPEVPNGDFWLSGSVINGSTYAGIAGAKVYFGSKTSLTTDEDGNYAVNCKAMGSGSFEVRVMADGYCFGFASATIASNSAMVNTIVLTPLSGSVSIGSGGGSVIVSDPEALAPDSKTTLVIPAGAFSTDVPVTLTRFMGMEVPGYAPVNTLNLCAVNIGSAGTVPVKAMELHFALPFADAGLNNLPLLKYNFETNVWENVAGASALINHTNNTAVVQVTTFGTYSLSVAGSFTESNGSCGEAVTMPLDPLFTSVDLSYLATNDYPGGTPSTISAIYLENIASQNTKLHGTRSSFIDLTLCTYNYIGTKPDSLVPVKSTMAGYYRWVPKVSYATQDMPTSTTINNVAVTGIITKEVYSPLSGWEYVHDQGGGGK